MTEPQRLLDGDDAEIAALLRSARDDDPGDDDRRAVAAAVGVTVGATAIATAAAAKGGVAKLGALTVAKIGAAVALVFSIGVATGVTVERSRSARVQPQPTIVAPPVVAVAPSVSVTPVVVPSVTPSAAPSASMAPLPVPVAVPSTLPATAPSLLAQETLLLGRARAAIARHDYGDAIAALDAYDVVAPSGVLAQESRALRVQALAEQGKRLTALDLGHAFLAQYPASPYAKRVRAIVDQLEAQ